MGLVFCLVHKWDTGATLAGGAWAGDIATAAAGACAMDGATYFTHFTKGCKNL